MCADWRGPWGEDPEGEGAPGDPRPFGTRPFGTRPFGTRPFGTRPFGTRPFGTRPFGTRPFGTRDDGDGGDGTLDAAEWTADITQLFCLCSAVVRLGARVVVDKTEVPVVAVGDPASGPLAYLEQPKTTNPKTDKEGVPKESEEKPEARVSQRLLRPRDHELALKVILPNHLIRDLVDFPEVAAAVKEDIAYRLAMHADGAFLRGGGEGTPEPLGVVSTAGVPSVPIAAGPDFLATARTMVDVARRGQPPLPARPAYFGSAGWVLHPSVLAALTATNTSDFLAAGNGVSLDSRGELLSYDGGDGGCLLGYPFIVSEGAGDNGMVFGADWSEAWIGIDCDFVTVDISTDVQFQTDETVVRAVMHHVFVVRTPRSFVYAALPAQVRRRGGGAPRRRGG
jgi:HK97 family phage major capsid protein